MDYSKLLNELLLPFLSVFWALSCAGLGIGFLLYLVVYRYKHECKKELLKYNSDTKKRSKTDILYDKVDYLVSCANKQKLYLDKDKKDE